jgi:hypothetical protein
LHAAGGRVIGIADARGATFNDAGLDVPRLLGHVYRCALGLVFGGFFGFGGGDGVGCVFLSDGCFFFNSTAHSQPTKTKLKKRSGGTLWDYDGGTPLPSDPGAYWGMGVGRSLLSVQTRAETSANTDRGPLPNFKIPPKNSKIQPKFKQTDFLAIPCDVLVPAAIGGVINSRTAPRLQCKVWLVVWCGVWCCCVGVVCDFDWAV